MGMSQLDAVTMVAILLCGLVAGVLFAFAVVVMPGIARLGDHGLLRAFQVIDGVIQDNQPLFLAVWLGSVLAVLAVAVLAVASGDGAGRVAAIAAAVVWLGGVQAPTVLVNVPLNNALQAHDVARLDDDAAAAARAAFEPRWNRWNAVRTALAVVTVVLLLLADRSA